MTDKIVVLCTCANEEEARRLARALVEARVAACVNIAGEVSSVYRWKGEVETAREWLLLIKSSRPMFEQLRAEIEKRHSYEVPEILALTVTDGAANYLDWLGAQLGA